jgi:hypothetical protein
MPDHLSEALQHTAPSASQIGVAMSREIKVFSRVINDLHALMPRLSRVQRKIFKVERSASSDTGDSPYALVALKPRARSCLRHRIVPRSMSKFVDEATQTINILILVSFDPNDVVGGQQTRQPILNSRRSRPRMTRSELLVKWSV